MHLTLFVLSLQHLLPRFALKPNQLPMYSCSLFHLQAGQVPAATLPSADPTAILLAASAICLASACASWGSQDLVAASVLNKWLTRTRSASIEVDSFLHRGIVAEHALHLIACHRDFISKRISVSYLVVQHCVPKLQGVWCM